MLLKKLTYTDKALSRCWICKNTLSHLKIWFFTKLLRKVSFSKVWNSVGTNSAHYPIFSFLWGMNMNLYPTANLWDTAMHAHPPQTRNIKFYYWKSSTWRDNFIWPAVQSLTGASHKVKENNLISITIEVVQDYPGE